MVEVCACTPPTYNFTRWKNSKEFLLQQKLAGDKWGPQADQDRQSSLLCSWMFVCGCDVVGLVRVRR